MNITAIINPTSIATTRSNTTVNTNDTTNTSISLFGDFFTNETNCLQPHILYATINKIAAIYMKNSLFDGGSGNESAGNFEKAVNDSFNQE